MLENLLNRVSLNNFSGQSEKRYRSHPIELNLQPVFYCRVLSVLIVGTAFILFLSASKYTHMGEKDVAVKRNKMYSSELKCVF